MAIMADFAISTALLGLRGSGGFGSRWDQALWPRSTASPWKSGVHASATVIGSDYVRLLQPATAQSGSAR